MKPGTINKGYILLCFRCQITETILASSQGRAERYAREVKGWSKKVSGWHCAKCKDRKPNQAELLAARAVANNPELFSERK